MVRPGHAIKHFTTTVKNCDAGWSLFFMEDQLELLEIIIKAIVTLSEMGQKDLLIMRVQLDLLCALIMKYNYPPIS